MSSRVNDFVYIIQHNFCVRNIYIYVIRTRYDFLRNIMCPRAHLSTFGIKNCEVLLMFWKGK